MELFEITVGSRIYKIYQNTLGQGYRSKVRLAVVKDTKQQCAVKMVEKSPRETVNDRARKEIELLRKVQGHPNIVRLLDAHEDDTFFYIFLERHEQTLLEYIEQNGGFLAPERAAELFRQVVSGLQHCLARQVSHLDIKLENVMMTPENNAVLIDFGFAEESARGYKLTVGRGSFRYVSPEIAAYEDFEPAKADVWALGVLLYAMCTGMLPFPGDEENVQRLFRTIRAGKYEVPADLPEDLLNLIAGMLEVDPARRLELSAIATHPFMTQHASPLLLRQSGSSTSVGSNTSLRGSSGTTTIPLRSSGTVPLKSSAPLKNSGMSLLRSSGAYVLRASQQQQPQPQPSQSQTSQSAQSQPTPTPMDVSQTLSPVMTPMICT